MDKLQESWMNVANALQRSRKNNKPTNFERIKNMTVEELAELFNKQSTTCQYSGMRPGKAQCKLFDNCLKCNKASLIKWLESEVKADD